MRKFGIIALLTVCGAVAAHADSITHTGPDLLEGGYTLSDSANTGWTESGAAGLIGFTDNTTNLAYQGYCVSPYIYLGGTWDATVSTNNLTDPNPNSHSVTFSSFGAVVADKVAYLAGINVAGDAHKAAAIQCAIWETEVPTILISGKDSSLVSYYEGLVANPVAHSDYHLFTPTHNDSQKLIVTDNPTHIDTVPEPVSTCLGLAGVGAFIRRRVKKSA